MIFFLIFAQKHTLWVLHVRTASSRRGGSNEYPQSMFWIKNKKNVYPCKPQFYYIKTEFAEVYINRHVILMYKVDSNSRIEISLHASSMLVQVDFHGKKHETYIQLFKRINAVLHYFMENPHLNPNKSIRSH